ncbi:hypothetical protein HXY32_03935 [Candidatus Bathyarchaeota archaeon]|nr:hypothetical protein [Candidatus Bathyarchaeota archaeon]
MLFDWKLDTKSLALAISFTALYVVFGFVKISPIIGLPNQAITAAAIMAPIMGIILGSYIGMTSTILGGIIGFFAGSLSVPSLVSGVFAASYAGILHERKRSLCVFSYFSLLFLFGFYPFVGPVWLYPALMWFQIVGFLILVSPLMPIALKSIGSKNKSKSFFGFFITSLVSTLAGQIAGSLAFELLTWPIFLANVNAWKAKWQVITFLYPVERTIIALSASFVGTTLYEALKSSNILSSYGKH